MKARSVKVKMKVVVALKQSMPIIRYCDWKLLNAKICNPSTLDLCTSSVTMYNIAVSFRRQINSSPVAPKTFEYLRELTFRVP